MLNVNPYNLICIILNLLILAALMKKFLYKPVMGIIEKRQSLINEQMKEAASCQQDAKQLKEKYEASLRNMQGEKESLMQETKTQAKMEYDRILLEAKEEASQLLEHARKASESEKEKAIRAADKEIARLAAEAAAKIVGETSDSTQDAHIYEDFLKKAGEASGTDN